jgi:hypothetical protein
MKCLFTHNDMPVHATMTCLFTHNDMSVHTSKATYFTSFRTAKCKTFYHIVIKIKSLTFSLKLTYYYPACGGKCSAALISLFQLQMFQRSSHKAAAIAAHITEFSGDSGISFQIRQRLSRRLGDASLSTDNISWTKLSSHTRDHRNVAGL